MTIGNFLTALPGALRYIDDASFQTLPFYELEIIGTFAAGMASGTTLNIAVQQALPSGTKYSTLVSLAAIPAYGAVTWWRAVVRFLPYTGNGLTAWSTLEALGTAGISNFGLSALTSGGFDITQNVPFSINILVNSPSNNPLTSNGFLYRIK